MNNDLISRQQMLEYLEEEENMIHDDAERFGINKDVVEGMKQNINSVMDYVEEADVAYDIEKVVEELKENASRYTKKYVTPYGNNGYKDTKAVSINKAIEIVKQGCVDVVNNATTKNDDVCECRLLKGYNFLHKTSCGDVFEMENGFKFCPYCGKKIKIVGG